MNKQEFIAMSLPFNLRGRNTDAGDVIGQEWMGIKKIIGMHSDSIIQATNSFPYCITYHINKILPIVRPMTGLTVEITNNCETFVPIVELAKIMYPNHEWKLSASGNYAVVGNGYCTFEYDGGYDCFLMNNSAQMPQLVCLLKLVEWHFDVAELIDKKEAIDCNSIKNFNYYE